MYANADDLGSLFSSIIPMIVKHGPAIASKIWDALTSNNASDANNNNKGVEIV